MSLYNRNKISTLRTHVGCIFEIVTAARNAAAHSTRKDEAEERGHPNCASEFLRGVCDSFVWTVRTYSDDWLAWFDFRNLFEIDISNVLIKFHCSHGHFWNFDFSNWSSILIRWCHLSNHEALASWDMLVDLLSCILALNPNNLSNHDLITLLAWDN